MKLKEIKLDKKLMTRWSKEVYLAGVRGISFETIKEQIKTLFVIDKEGEK